MCVCVCARVRAYVHMLSYVVINLFLAIIVICLNTFILFVFLNSFVRSHVTLVVCFKANFLLRTIKYYLKNCMPKTRSGHTR